MTTVALSLGTRTAITITLTSLANGGYRESAEVDNSSNLYVDALVEGSIQVGAVSADGTISIYAYGNLGDTVYTGGLAGTNETITWGTTPSSSSVEGFNQLPLLGVVSVDATDDSSSSSGQIEFGPYAIAPAFGGVMPAKWGIVVLNSTGTGFHATGTPNGIWYRGVKYTNT